MCNSFSANGTLKHQRSLSFLIMNDQRRRDDKKKKNCSFRGVGPFGAERKIVKSAVFHGKRHDNKILKVQVLLSRTSVVVIAQAPINDLTTCRRAEG